MQNFKPKRHNLSNSSRLITSSTVIPMNLVQKERSHKIFLIPIETNCSIFVLQERGGGGVVDARTFLVFGKSGGSRGGHKEDRGEKK